MASKKVKSLIKKIQTLSEEERRELASYLFIEDEKRNLSNESELSDEEKTRAFIEAAGSWSNIPDSIIDELYAHRSIHTRPEAKL